MATAIKYFDTAKVGYARVTTGVLNTDGSGASTPVTWYGSAPAGDWMLVKVIVSATSATGAGDMADSLFHVFIDDGTTCRLIRTIDMANATAGTATLPGFQAEIAFGQEWVFPSTVMPEFSVSVTVAGGNCDVVVLAQSA